MDSDLQHPPETIPVLLESATNTESDIVVATRYIKGGSAEGLGSVTTFYGIYRRGISLGMKYFTQIIFSQTRRTTDPLGGFFLFRKDILREIEFEPKGFKILVEILMRAKYESVSEVPYKFLSRENEVSKANFKQGVEFLKHLWHIFLTVPHAGRFIKFCFVGLIGVAVNLGTLFLLVEYWGISQYTAWLVAVLLSILSNFIFNNIITFGDRTVDNLISRIAQICKYYLLSLGMLVVNFGIYYFALSLGLYYMFSATAGIIVAMLFNYVLASFLVWPSTTLAKN